MTPFIVLSLLLPLSAARAQDHQALWSAQLSATALIAQAAAQKVSLEERIRRATAVDAAALPAHVAEGIKERRDKLAATDAFRLRAFVVEQENALSMDPEAPSCQSRLSSAVQDHRSFTARASSEMTEIHAEILALVRTTAAALVAATYPLKTRLELDAKIMDDLRARFNPDAQNVRNVSYDLSGAWKQALRRDFGPQTEQTALMIKARSAALKLSDEFDRGSREEVLRIEFAEAGPILVGCAPVLASEQALPGQEKYRLIYASCVRVSLRDRKITGEDLASSLRGGRSSAIVEKDEKTYVAEASRSCLDLAAARLALADR